MNSVYLSGRVNSPIIVVSAENAALHIKTTIKVSHLNAARLKKDDIFTISVWRETAKRFMEQARIGSSIMLEGYLSTQSSNDSIATEITVTEFKISNIENSTKKSAHIITEDCAFPNDNKEEPTNKEPGCADSGEPELKKGSENE